MLLVGTEDVVPGTLVSTKYKAQVHNSKCKQELPELWLDDECSLPQNGLARHPSPMGSNHSARILPSFFSPSDDDRRPSQILLSHLFDPPPPIH